MEDQPKSLTINGATYNRAGSDYRHQINQVCDMLGQSMFEALAEAGAIIAGGAILSAFTHQEINDVDVYFRSKKDMAQAFIRVTEKWNSVYLGHTDKSITLKDRDTGTTVQFIHFEYFDTPEKVFDAFDFTVCMAAIDLVTLDFSSHPDFVSDMASRTLHFNPGTRFPYISLVRTKKYHDRGYKIGKGTMLAIANACARMPINSWIEAKDQLGGVYGYEIDLQIDNDAKFNTESLHEVSTAIREDRPIVVNNNYEEILQSLKDELSNELVEQLEKIES